MYPIAVPFPTVSLSGSEEGVLTSGDPLLLTCDVSFIGELLQPIEIVWQSITQLQGNYAEIPEPTLAVTMLVCIQTSLTVIAKACRIFFLSLKYCSVHVSIPSYHPQ